MDLLHRVKALPRTAAVASAELTTPAEQGEAVAPQAGCVAGGPDVVAVGGTAGGGAGPGVAGDSWAADGHLRHLGAAVELS